MALYAHDHGVAATGTPAGHARFHAWRPVASGGRSATRNAVIPQSISSGCAEESSWVGEMDRGSGESDNGPGHRQPDLANVCRQGISNYPGRFRHARGESITPGIARLAGL